MKILIIGSKGFIGSHCVTYFANNHEVWQCDVVTDYVSEKYIVVDVTNANYNEIFQTHTFDVCINCSGAANVSDSLKNPQRDFMLNTVNVFNQLEAIRRYNSKCKYINFSSAAVYGNPEYLPIDENHPLSPISPYGVHKQLAEQICEEFFKTYKIACCSLRVFSVYGPGLQKQLFWDLYKKSKNASKVTLFGTGNESRDFIYISDLIQALELVILNSSFKNNIINVANNKEQKINDIVTAFYKYYDANVTIEFGGEERAGDPINWKADINKLKELGYEPQVNINEGLRKYITWLKERE
ncbi:NAD-dependent epimerase/dehydratase family protein [Flavivirga algicola]|uniref:NAD-dependent epimerase/dehydratase family protein n=1 Tax=Flavivirga algicola TaxID=2729136 RepID=A0ABX1RS33_9FLAO|nr:NAD-dependent epimerase/dehydratase family protein [Flavivirga algicola]NMH86357.1 NAD-dependent epimerase/dehydratase family protein [Flavivirga algicola]